ncbi:MAG: hypothetical protein IIB19_01330 [Chloroflexi bacterium]|nr:hypothetical protein [Chloroflexota bacterium]
MAEQISIEFQFRNKRFRDAQKGLEAFASELGKDVQKLGPILTRGLQRYLDEVRRALIRRHGKPFSNPTNVPATGSSDLLSRSGGIKRITTLVKSSKDLNLISGTMIVPFPISVHERGTTITARSAKFLTIPLSAALSARGIPLRPKARDWNNTFVQRSKRGNLLIFQRRGAQIVPLYLLKRSVTLPPRLKAEETLMAGEDFFVESLITEMSKAILG